MRLGRVQVLERDAEVIVNQVDIPPQRRDPTQHGVSADDIRGHETSRVLLQSKEHHFVRNVVLAGLRQAFDQPAGLALR